MHLVNTVVYFEIRNTYYFFKYHLINHNPNDNIPTSILTHGLTYAATGKRFTAPKICESYFVSLLNIQTEYVLNCA